MNHGMSWLACLGSHVLVAKSDVYDSRASTVLKVGHGRFQRNAGRRPLIPTSVAVFSNAREYWVRLFGGRSLHLGVVSFLVPSDPPPNRLRDLVTPFDATSGGTVSPGRQKADDGSAGGRYTPPC
jgi:hypothetical protein